MIVTSRNIYGEEMRITETLLRRIIREELLSESPPGYIDYFENPLSQDTTSPSIGYPRTRSRRPKYRKGGYENIARELMKDIEDNWVVVSLSDFRYAKDVIKTEAFKTWLNQKYPGYRVIIAAGRNYKGDIRTPHWQIAHDIIGHSINQIWGRYQYDQFIPGDVQAAAISALHRALPDEMRIAPARGDDTAPDILAAIMLNRFSREEAMAVIDRLSGDDETARRVYTMLVDSMFESVDRWLSQEDEDGIIIARPF